MRYTDGYPIVEDSDLMYSALKVTQQIHDAFYATSGALGPGDSQLITQMPKDANGDYPQLRVDRLNPLMGIIVGSVRANSAIAAGTTSTITSSLPAAVTPKSQFWGLVDVADGAAWKRIRLIIQPAGKLLVSFPDALAAGAQGTVSIIYPLF